MKSIVLFAAAFTLFEGIAAAQPAAPRELILQPATPASPAINRAITEFQGTPPPIVIQTPPCNQVAYQYKPGLLDGVELEVLENASAVLTAVLATFARDGSAADDVDGDIEIQVDDADTDADVAADATIDRELYDKALQVARLIDEICPNGECAGGADDEPLDDQ